MRRAVLTLAALASLAAALALPAERAVAAIGPFAGERLFVVRKASTGIPDISSTSPSLCNSCSISDTSTK